MRTFVYGSRVIENEQQIKFEHRFKLFGNCVGMVVKLVAAFFFFVVLNTLLSNLAQHTDHLFTVNTYRLIQEGTRVLLIDNVFTTTSIIYQDIFSIVSALAAAFIVEYGLVMHMLGNTDSESASDEKKNCNSEQRTLTVNGYNTVSYKQKVCFLS